MISVNDDWPQGIIERVAQTLQQTTANNKTDATITFNDHFSFTYLR